ncbi:hypothetical protein KJ973_01685 [Patescibacteria group bacterium]|nr:hypothetical protein [Patescibacteria group bacterium]MBU1246605.1 hypothetical protein [Patescibacteria group bacterium]MBU1519386.1 hypothetical protein [Patescibacteria group bacterium]MBU1730226.1 hypothetical protein [Patescibacteria group bacterium]MBU1956344.1 hypothetical protein [Patescibacteria group bacterium]
MTKDTNKKIKIDKIAEEIKKCRLLQRKDVFITNVVKCRAPNNRDPLPDEVSIHSIPLETT